MSTLKTPGIRPQLPAKTDWATTSIRMVGALSAFLPARAFAQDWSAPATTMLGQLESGLVSIAAPVIGIGVISYGIWAIGSGRIDMMRLAQLVVAGALIIIGPTALRALLSVA